MASHLAVTIARQYGSGGREIGELTAKILGCKVYGRELTALSAKESNLSEDALRRADEVAAGSLLYTLAMGSSAFNAHPISYNMPINDKLFYTQSDLIRRLAGEGDGVFIGRCADYVLREHPMRLSVFIYADEGCRIERIMERTGLQKSKALDQMNKVDRRRASYYNFYTGQKWGRVENYDLAINSSLLGVQGTAEAIAELALKLKSRE